MDKGTELERLEEELAFKMTVNGKEIICYILLHFNNPDTGKKYIVYTDGTKKEDGTLEILASTYEIDNGRMELGEITEDSEWDLVDEMLQKVGEINE